MSNISLDAFQFFNGLTGSLNIKLSEEPHQKTPQLLNKFASKTALLESLDWKPTVYRPDNDDDPFRPVTQEELDQIAHADPAITIQINNHETTIQQSPQRMCYHN